MIYKYQGKDKELPDKIKSAKYHTKYFCRGGKFTQLIYRSEKFVMPKVLQKYGVNWYHKNLLHPGMDCTEATISQI